LLGLEDGVVDGPMVGLDDGLVDGDVDGAMVGLLEGDRVGLVDGDVEGAMVGLLDGDVEGVVGLFSRQVMVKSTDRTVPVPDEKTSTTSNVQSPSASKPKNLLRPSGLGYTSFIDKPFP